MVRGQVGSRWCALIVGLTILVPATAWAQGPRLELNNLTRLVEQADDVTDIALDSALLQLAGGLLANGNSDTKQVKELISGLTGIYVKSFKFERDSAFTQADLEVVRKQLSAPQWARMVATQNSQGRESVEVYSWREGDRSGGLAIVVAEPRELTVVNIVGQIDLAKLAQLQGHFGIPTLPTK